MFYEGFSADGRRNIGVTVSEDGLGGWRRHSEPILTGGEDSAWDEAEVGAPCAVSMAQGRWRLYYAGAVSNTCLVWCFLSRCSSSCCLLTLRFRSLKLDPYICSCLACELQIVVASCGMCFPSCCCSCHSDARGLVHCREGCTWCVGRHRRGIVRGRGEVSWRPDFVYSPHWVTTLIVHACAMRWRCSCWLNPCIKEVYINDATAL
jgi:hypothetical protein